jgi:two-component system chemotaxis response regulator CheY
VPELALIDWNMPNMNGLEFVTKVRGRPAAARDDAWSWSRPRASRARSSGARRRAHEYVIKPFTEGAMIEKLALLGLVPTGANS